MRAENPDFYQNKITRRQALTLLFGGGLAVVYGGYRIKTAAIPRFFPSVPEAKDVGSNQVEAGVVAIYEGVNIRTAPTIPDKTRFKQPDNRLGWEQIDTINGVPLNGKSAFMVVNPHVVVGQNTTEYTRDGFDWIKLNIKKKGDDSVKPYYINDSINTGHLVTRLGYAGYIVTQDGQVAQLGVYKFDSELLDVEDIDRIIVPENLDSMAGDIMPELWSKRMRKQFEGKIPPAGRLVTGVPAVDTIGDKDDARINVREYPSLQYGNGEEVKVVGTVAQGTILNKVIMPPDDYYHFDFAAVLSEDLNGSLADVKGDLVAPTPGRVYAIASPYLLVL